ncbi:MAG TPA: hypothetical protein VMO00_00970 [Methylomirabilota bacterium]|nr:hypothetical protein [Methylomirabilota bacterium]
MRLTKLITTALALFVAAVPLFAQEWVEFASREDRFTCLFPTQPKVTETTYLSQHEANLPARVYTASQGQSRYSMTVVDYNQAQRILTEKSKSCPAGAEPCLGGPGDEGHWKADIRGAIDWATWQFLQRDAKVTLFVWANMDLVEGRQLQLTNADKSRTFVGIFMHQNKLYITEGTVPPRYPEPALFQQSLGWLDENGVGLRYTTYYSNNYPAPPKVDRSRRPGQGRIDAPGSVVQAEKEGDK